MTCHSQPIRAEFSDFHANSAVQKVYHGHCSLSWLLRKPSVERGQAGLQGSEPLWERPSRHRSCARLGQCICLGHGSPVLCAARWTTDPQSDLPLLRGRFSSAHGHSCAKTPPPDNQVSMIFFFKQGLKPGKLSKIRTGKIWRSQKSSGLYWIA